MTKGVQWRVLLSGHHTVIYRTRKLRSTYKAKPRVSANTQGHSHIKHPSTRPPKKLFNNSTHHQINIECFNTYRQEYLLKCIINCIGAKNREKRH